VVDKKAQNSSNNLPSYRPYNHHRSEAVYRSGQSISTNLIFLLQPSYGQR